MLCRFRTAGGGLGGSEFEPSQRRTQIIPLFPFWPLQGGRAVVPTHSNQKIDSGAKSSFVARAPPSLKSIRGRRRGGCCADLWWRVGGAAPFRRSELESSERHILTYTHTRFPFWLLLFRAWSSTSPSLGTFLVPAPPCPALLVWTLHALFSEFYLFQKTQRILPLPAFLGLLCAGGPVSLVPTQFDQKRDTETKAAVQISWFWGGWGRDGILPKTHTIIPCFPLWLLLFRAWLSTSPGGPAQYHSV